MLQQYKFILKYRPGKKNANADYLSRVELPENINNAFVMATEITPTNFANMSNLQKSDPQLKHII